MLDLASTRIHPLTEAIFDAIVEAAGGRRAHPDQHLRDRRGADYVLGDTVIELKILDEDGLSKAARQRKLAALLVALEPGKPVHVLDRNRLGEADRHAYDRTLEGPIKSAVRSARAQLVQSRLDYPETKRSVLVIANNGNTALDHDEIVRLVSHRIRNDTREIDGVVVAGAYLHSDGLDSYALWPIDYVPIQLGHDFPEHAALHKAFHAYAERSMTAALTEGPSEAMTKGPALDTSFEVDGITFVKPVPALGGTSHFYPHGRPRLNSTGIEKSPPVGLIFPELDRAEWGRFRAFLPQEPALGDSYRAWLQERDHALNQGTALQPLVPIPITLEDWLATLDGEIPHRPFASIGDFATGLFHGRVAQLIDAVRDIDKANILPSRFVLACTELIGQDEANDVSRILLVEQAAGFSPRTTTLLPHARIFHLHACSLGAAYAVKHDAPALLWQKDMTYAWA